MQIFCGLYLSHVPHARTYQFSEMEIHVFSFGLPQTESSDIFDKYSVIGMNEKKRDDNRRTQIVCASVQERNVHHSHVARLPANFSAEIALTISMNQIKRNNLSSFPLSIFRRFAIRSSGSRENY